MTTIESNMTVVEVPQFAVLDFDRTLSSYDVTMARVYGAMGTMGIAPELVADELTRVEQNRKSYNPLLIIEQKLGERVLSEFMDRFAAMSEYSLLYPDALPFLHRLTTGGVPYKVLTYGDSLWQRLKVESSSYVGDYEVTSKEDKGLCITDWKNEDGLYVIDDEVKGITYHAESVCLVDDKAKAFHGLSADNTGFCLRRPGENRRDIEGVFPPHVLLIHNLGELVVKDGHVEYGQAA